MPNAHHAKRAAPIRVLCAVATFWAACALPGLSSAKPLPDSPVIFRSGDWAVHRTHDSMTDANICTAIYRNNFDIQLGSHSLDIAIAGGLRSVTLRFDNDTAREMRLPKRSEHAVSALNIEGADFQRLQQSSRLRYRVLTATDNIVEGDIDLTGANDAYKNIQSGCLGSPVAAVNR
jgi:hypothetical protein